MKNKIVFVVLLLGVMMACEEVSPSKESKNTPFEEGEHEENGGESGVMPGYIQVLSVKSLPTEVGLNAYFLQADEFPIFYKTPASIHNDFNGLAQRLELGAKTEDHFVLSIFLFSYHSQLEGDGWVSTIRDNKKFGTAGYPTKENVNRLYEEAVRSMGKDWFELFFAHSGVKELGIVADKPLFGRVAGEELNDKFKVVYCPPLLAEFPSYDIIKKIDAEGPKLLSEMCAKPFVLPLFDIAVKFAEVPAEKYDEITFTVAMDILLPDGGERTLTGSVKVAFE